MRIPSGWSANVLFVLILAIIVAFIVGAGMINAQLVYGDWRCAFAHCVRVVR